MARIDLRPKSKYDLLRSLRDVRTLFDIVAVECSNTQVSSVAFRDRRVDLVFFPVGRLQSRLSWLIPKKLKRPVELNIADLLRNESSAESNLVRAINLIADAQRKHMPLVASSGATDLFSLRAPRDMAAVLSVLGLESSSAVSAVSDRPYSMIQRNLERREPDFISDGIRMVRRRT
jgi:RNase P/RNase MRP subunit p30